MEYNKLGKKIIKCKKKIRKTLNGKYATLYFE